MRRFFYILLIIITVIVSGSCSIRKMAINEIASMAKDGMAAFEQDDDLDLVIKSLPANIKLFEVMLENDPENRNLLTLLAYMYGSYGFAYYETKMEGLLLGVENINASVNYFADADIKQTGKRLENYYLKGTGYALRALETNHPGCSKYLDNIKQADKFFQIMEQEDVPALFWYGFNLGGYVNLNRDSVRALSKISLVEKAMQRVVELDPDYFHAGGHLFLSSFYAMRSPMMGGNLKAAQFHHEELKKKTGRQFLLADVFYARYYLYQKQDQEAFEKILTSVISSQCDKKKYALFNQVAIDRAKIYLKAVDDLFP